MHLDMLYMKEFVNFTHVFWWSLYFMDTEALNLNRDVWRLLLADLGIKNASLNGHNKACETQSFCLFLNADEKRIQVWPQLGNRQNPIVFA